jgi:hypothetical protein
MKLAFKITRFLSFAMGCIVMPEQLQCGSREITEDHPEAGKVEARILLYYEQLAVDESKKDLRSVLFHFSVVRKEFQEIISSWFDSYDRAEPAFNLYFASKSGAHRYLEGRFLSLAQGIEVLHRMNSRDTFMTENEFGELNTLLLNACPSERRDWLTKKLKYANELPLRKRLNHMLDPFEGFFGNKHQRKDFVNQVVNTRNYFTHYDPTIEKSSVSGKNLWSLCMKLEALFQLHLLRLIGIDQELMGQLVRGSEELRRTLNI